MARDGITQAQVFNAADQISADGQQPTVAGIRTKLGTGSYTTITNLLRAWKAKATAQDDEPTDVPEAVTEALERAGQIVWKAAQDHFQQELKTLRAEAAKAAALAQEQIDEAFAEIERLEQTYEATVNDNCKVTQALTAAQEELAQYVRKLSAAEATIYTQEARITEQSSLLNRLTTGKPDPTPTKEPGATPKATRKPGTKTPKAPLAETPAGSAAPGAEPPAA